MQMKCYMHDLPNESKKDNLSGKGKSLNKLWVLCCCIFNYCFYTSCHKHNQKTLFSKVKTRRHTIHNGVKAVPSEQHWIAFPAGAINRCSERKNTIRKTNGAPHPPDSQADGIMWPAGFWMRRGGRDVIIINDAVWWWNTWRPCWFHHVMIYTWWSGSASINATDVCAADLMLVLTQILFDQRQCEPK